MTSSEPIKLYTDGSGTSEGEPGGWAAILAYGSYRRELSGGAADLPVNEAELRAIEEGLSAIRLNCITVEITTDSKNVIGWLYGFNVVDGRPDPLKRFKRKNPRVAAAVDRIEQIQREKVLTLVFNWTKGHAGHPENERCDELAGAARRALLSAHETPVT